MYTAEKCFKCYACDDAFYKPNLKSRTCKYIMYIQHVKERNVCDYSSNHGVNLKDINQWIQERNALNVIIVIMQVTRSVILRHI